MTGIRDLAFCANVESFQWITRQADFAAERLRLECCGRSPSKALSAVDFLVCSMSAACSLAGQSGRDRHLLGHIGRRTAEDGRTEPEPEAALLLKAVLEGAFQFVTRHLGSHKQFLPGSA